jgi:hypothetical protein
MNGSVLSKRIGGPESREIGVMARPLRIEYEGAFYHVAARGNMKYGTLLNLMN